MSEHEPQLYGVSAEFATPEALLAAASLLRELGIGRLDMLSPLPIPGAAEALGLGPPALGRLALGGVLLGGFGCFGMIVFATVYSYPFDIGGRPLLSWPYYVIPSFAAAMLVGAIVVSFGMFFLGRLPRLNHPVFNIDGIEGVSQDRLFLVVEARTEDFDPRAVEHQLASLPMRPLRIQRVPR
jgi:hypothetical protein